MEIVPTPKKDEEKGYFQRQWYFMYKNWEIKNEKTMSIASNNFQTIQSVKLLCCKGGGYTDSFRIEILQ